MRHAQSRRTSGNARRQCIQLNAAPAAHLHCRPVGHAQAVQKPWLDIQLLEPAGARGRRGPGCCVRGARWHPCQRVLALPSASWRVLCCAHQPLISGPPPCTSTGRMPTVARRTRSRITPSCGSDHTRGEVSKDARRNPDNHSSWRIVLRALSDPSFIAAPPYLMTTVLPEPQGGTGSVLRFNLGGPRR